MTKLDYMRLERIENRFDRNHPGRRLAKRWYKAVFNLSDAIEWVWSMEINKLRTESLGDTHDDPFKLDDVQPEIKFWREKRKISWIETFWSSEWDQGQRSTGTFFQHPDDPTDLVVTVAAEDQFNFKDQLTQIAAPTLVVAGDQDPFYSEDLFRETAEGIPNARLILYEGMGHPASGKQFQRDVLDFLKEDG